MLRRAGITTRYRTALRPLSLTAIIFFTVSGGPYGLEPLLNNVAPGPALALIILMPLLWSVPVMLMVLELTSMMPEEGGYYRWVQEALGRRWGFYEGWWSWLYTMVDLAIYPVLFVQYLTYLLPSVGAWQVPLGMGIIWTCAILNLLGVLSVGRSSVALGIAVLLPFAALFLSVFTRHASGVAVQASLPGSGATGLAMGMYTVMWNYLGWDNASTVAGEVQRPVRSYSIAMGAAFCLIVCGYVLSVLAGTRSGIDPSVLEEQGYPALGLLAGGWWLGGLLAAGGMASALGLFVSTLCAVSRIPKVMADDGFLPAPLGRMTRRTAVPHVSILACATAVSLMAFWGFPNLLIIDVTLYGCALMLEFVSLAVLRLRRPGALRPFRVPLNNNGILLLASLPACCLLVALFAIFSTENAHTGAAVFTVAAVASGPAAWMMARRARESGTPAPPAQNP